MPVRSDTIADSVGVNVHLHYTDTPYANFKLVEPLLIGLGVRHTRDGLVDTGWKEYYRRHNELGRHGIHCLFVTSPRQSDTLLSDYPIRMADSFEGFEAPNEYNQSGDAHWPEVLKSFLPRLKHISDDTSVTKKKPFLVGPSLTQPNAYPQASGLQANFSYANLHNYFAGRNPGTSGWGGGGYGSIDWSLRLERSVWEDTPAITTETGYTTDPANKMSVPEEVQAAYIPRLILEQLLHHIQRTYIYELIDVGPKVSKSDAAFGLVRNDGSKKPSYLALRNLISVTSNRNDTSVLHDLPIAIGGRTSDVHHLLAQRENGKYLVFFWIEKQSYDVPNKKLVTVAPQEIVFRLDKAPRAAHLITWQPDGKLQEQTLKRTTDLEVSARDTISVIALTP